MKLVCGKEAVMPMEYIVPSLRIAIVTGMSDGREIEEIIPYIIGSCMRSRDQLSDNRRSPWHVKGGHTN